MKTTLKTILVFDQHGNLMRGIRYRTKREAVGNFRLFKKWGMIDPNTGEKVENITFELL